MDCRKTALARVKIVVLAPIPRVRDNTATAVNPGDFTSVLTPYLMSCQNVPIEISSSAPLQVGLPSLSLTPQHGVWLPDSGTIRTPASKIGRASCRERV